MNSIRTEFRQSLVLARRLSGRLLRRRAVALLTLCVFTGSAIAAALGFFAVNVERALDRDVAQFLGAPLVVRSKQPLPDEWWLAAPGLQHAHTASITTGAVGPGQYHSVALKAVSQTYPVQGTLQVIDDEGQRAEVQNVPGAGAAWLDNRAMASLGAKLGDRIQVGRASFVVSAELAFEPDRLTQLQHTLPRVMIGIEDLAETGVALDSGRAEFRHLFDATPETLDAFAAALPERLAPGYEVLRPAAGRHPFSRMSNRANRFLGMVKVLVLLLCGSAAAVLADTVVRGFALPSALLRCLGVERRAVAAALLLQLSAMALAAGLAGCLAGWLVQPLLGALLEPHLTLGAASFEVGAAFGAVSIGLVIIVAFVLPRLAALGNVPVVAALRGLSQWSRRPLVSVAAAVACAAGLLWVYSDNPRLTIILGTGVLTIVSVAALLGWLLSQLAGQSYRLCRGPVRVALRTIGRSPSRNVAPMATIALAVMAFLVTAMLRGSFLNVYHGERLDHDGNYLFTGLPAAHEPSFRQRVAAHGAEVAGLYPTVRANLETLNGVPLDEALTNESDTREETRSPVRLSWSDHLPANNVLVAGTWPAPGSSGVSVDSEAMSDLGLKLGDELGFRVGERTLTATITSSRAFQGGGSAVTFWFVFARDALAEFEQEYLGGLRISGDARATLADLSAEYPNLVITNLEQHLGRVRSIMAAVTRVMDSLMSLLLLAAGTVVLASALTSSEARRRQATLLRSLGATRATLSRMMLVEHGALGITAGAVGVLGAHLVASLMFRYQFDMSYRPDALVYALVPLAAAGAFVALGFAFQRETVRLPPARILQQT